MSKPTALGLIFICMIALQSIEAATKKKKDRTNSCPHDKYCTSCGEKKICQRCVFSYTNRLGVCQVPLVQIPHCSYYSSDSTCDTCFPGFYVPLGNNKVCEPIPVTNCAILVRDSTTQCAICKDMLLPNNAGQCVNNNVCTIDNCDLCATGTRCLQCKKGFMLSATDSCVAQTLENCLKGSDDKCTHCEDGYFHMKKECVWSNVQQLIMNVSRLPVVFALLLAAKMIA